MAQIAGIRGVFGIPDQANDLELLIALIGNPPGKVRFRFRANSLATVFIRNNGETRRYFIEDKSQKFELSWGLRLRGVNL